MEQLFHDHSQIMFKCSVITQSGLSVKDYFNSNFSEEQSMRTNELKTTFASEQPACSQMSSTACKSGTCSAGRGSPVTDAVTYQTNPLYNVPILLFDGDDSASQSATD